MTNIIRLGDNPAWREHVATLEFCRQLEMLGHWWDNGWLTDPEYGSLSAILVRNLEAEEQKS